MMRWRITWREILLYVRWQRVGTGSFDASRVREVSENQGLIFLNVYIGLTVHYVLPAVMYSYLGNVVRLY